MVAPLAAAVVIGVTSLFAWRFGGIHDFAPGACDRVEPYLFSELVGQELAVQQACDAICDHLAQSEPQKPLVLSSHGPPGVGKTMMHLLPARALYSRRPSADLACPGSQCLGYKVLYGLDYTASDQASQVQQTKAALMEHFRFHPQSLLVIEEYDKLDCPTRGLLKQLIDASHSTNVTINRSIIMLESNTGFIQLRHMLAKAGNRRKVTPEAAQRMLKDLIYDIWSKDSCESPTDTLKLMALVDHYLPFLPLEREHIRSLFTMRLQERQAELEAATKDTLSWSEEVLDLLVSKISKLVAQVDFDGAHPLEGAKEVRSLMTRYVTRALRAWEKERLRLEESGRAAHKAAKKRWKGLPPRALALQVDAEGKGLEIV